jgi:hypothetical protein
MYAQTIGGKVSQSLIDALLAALGTRPGAALLTAPNVHLFDQPHVADPVNDTPASFHETAFTGYATAAVTLAGPANAGAIGRLYRGSVAFAMTSLAGGTPMLYGVFITDTTNATLYWQCAFENPVPMSRIGDFLDCDVGFSLDFAQG